MEDRPNALVVPSAAIQTGLQGSYVWVIDTDAKGVTTARIQPVKVALAQGQVTIVDTGLTVGQNVVVDGADRLRPGQIVAVSAARQHSSQGAGQATGQGSQPAGGPFAATRPGAAASSGATGDQGNAKPRKKEQQ